jgi:methylenetetrahydrofolate reductase (NADPH)
VTTSISVELVPRSVESVLADAAVVAAYPEVTHINIPDIARFVLRSVDAIRLLRERFGDRFVYVPHVRAIAGVALHGDFPGDIALIVQGDIPPQFDLSKVACVADHIALVSDRIRVMAGMDPYRSSPKQEIALVEAKIAAGATGFFTQPFFSLPHLRYWDTILPNTVEIFYGVSPVTTEASLVYWRDKNHVVFPKDFSRMVSRQVAFAQRVIRFARAHGRSVYLMPIRIPLALYLSKVFAEKP